MFLKINTLKLYTASKEISTTTSLNYKDEFDSAIVETNEYFELMQELQNADEPEAQDNEQTKKPSIIELAILKKAEQGNVQAQNIIDKEIERSMELIKRRESLDLN
jgi:hypothetical protein